MSLRNQLLPQYRDPQDYKETFCDDYNAEETEEDEDDE